MKNKILAVYPDSVFQSSNASTLYIVDFSFRTDKKRGVEVHDTLPQEPNTPTKNMDCSLLSNEYNLSIDFNIFDDHQFKSDENKDIEHCECCCFPTNNDDQTWVSFIEIKDCKAKNINDFKDKAKEQIKSTVHVFRKHNIIDKKKVVYGIISFPRKNKISFNQTIFDDYTEYKHLFKSEKIRFFATNQVTIADKYQLNVIP